MVPVGGRGLTGRRRSARWPNLKVDELPWLLVVTPLVLALDLSLRVLGVRRTARLVRVCVSLGSDKPDGGVDAPLDDSERRRVRAVARVVRTLYGLDRGCLRFALATAMLVRGRRPVVRLGVVAAPGDALTAHAWVQLRGGAIRAGSAMPFEPV